MRRAPIVIAVALTLAPSAAPASGFLVARFGGEHGHVASDHITTIYYNPAGLALGSGTRIYLEGLVGYRSAQYDRPTEAIDNVVDPSDGEPGTPTDAVSSNAGKASLFNPVAAPFAAVATDFGVKNLGVAVGVSVPFGGSQVWDKNDEYDRSVHIGAVDGVQRWAIIEGTARSMYFTTAAAYRIPAARLSIGAGFNVVRTEVETVRAKNATGTDHLVTGTGAVQEGRVRLDVSGTHVSVGAGVNWQPLDTLWIGASYQSRPNFGESDLEGTLRTKLGAAEEGEGDVIATWPLPDVARLGARYRPTPTVELRLLGEFARWSVLDEHCGVVAGTGGECITTDTGAEDPDSGSISFNIYRAWNDTVSVRGGGSYWITPTAELYAGAGWDPSAVPDDSLDTSLIDLDKLTASVGGRFGVTDELTVSATYLQVIYFDKTIEPRERDAAGDSISPLVPPTRSPDTAGTYSQSVGVLSIGAEYTF